MALYKISSSRVNNINADQYTGSVVEEGLIWYDPNDGLLRLYTGNVGGRIINSGGAGGNPIEIDYNGNLITSDVRKLNFTGNGVVVTGSGQDVTVDISSSPTDQIELGNSNVRVWPNGDVTVSIDGNANTAIFTNSVAIFNQVSVSGNVVATEFIGNGSRLSNISGANVVGNVANATYASLSNVANFANSANTAVTVTGNSQPNINQVGTLVSLSVTGNIRTSANITGSYLFGNGYYLTGISGGGGASFPPQAGNTGLVLMTNGTDVYWNSGLAASYTFLGGAADSEAGAVLDGGGANADYTGEAQIYGGSASSDYSLTLSSLALTGQYEDLENAPDTTPVPSTATSVGQKGQMAFDNNYLYVCVANNIWRRASLNSW